MKLFVRKDVYIQILKSLFNSSEHPRGAGGKFITKFAPDTGHNGGGLTKQNSGIDQTKLDALECNTAIELKHIPFLKANLKNYYDIGTTYIKNLNKDLKDQELKCKNRR